MPTSSFADIAFLLITLLYSHHDFDYKVRGREIDAPSGQTAEKQEQEEMPTIQLEGTSVLFNEEEVSWDALDKRLADLKLPEQEGAGKIVLLDPSDNVEWGDYFKAQNAIARFGGVVGSIKEKPEP